MPKIVDHEARRAELADAMNRVIARDGLAAASVRAVAAEAGWSLGAVQHYFGNVDEMLRFAVRRLDHSLTLRIAAVLGSDAPPADRARLLLEELLPLDEQRYGEQRVWLELVVRSRFEPDLRVVADTSWDLTRRAARLAVLLLAGDPHLPAGALPQWEYVAHPLPDPAAEQRAAQLQVMVDGLFLHGLIYTHLSADDIRLALQRWFGSRQ